MAIPASIDHVIHGLLDQEDAQAAHAPLLHLKGDVRIGLGQGTGDATVRFDFDPSDRLATITFLDGGVPFDPLKKADPDVTLSAEERQVGGLGIFLVKKTMDDMTYRFEDGKNVLTIYKHI